MPKKLHGISIVNEQTGRISPIAEIDDRWDEAEAQTRIVIDRYEAGYDRLKNLASEAYANIGMLYKYRPFDSEFEKEENLQAAIASYEEALALAKWTDRQSLYQNQIAQLQQMLNE